MNRREFLRVLGIGTGIAAVQPKLIFDVGANLWKPRYEFVDGLFDHGFQYAVAITVISGDQEYRHAIRAKIPYSMPLSEVQYFARKNIRPILERRLLDWKQQRFGA